MNLNKDLDVMSETLMCIEHNYNCLNIHLAQSLYASLK